MKTIERRVPMGEPPAPDGAVTLDQLADRLQRLRSWAGLSLRDLLERVEILRRVRGIPDERGVRPSYGAVQALFQAERKRLDESLLLDVVRVLLDRQAQSQLWREEQVTVWHKAYRTIIRQPIREVHGPGFSIGPLRTPCQILEGDGEHVIEEEHVRVLVNPVSVRLPDELAEWREQVVRDQLRRRQVGAPHAWNGPKYAVEDLVISRAGPEERPDVTLRLKHSDYYTFLATQDLDRQFRNGTSPRSRYVDGRHPRDVPDFMRSSFGLNVAMVTADEWLVVSRRSDRVGVGQNWWNSSANEGLHRQLDAPDGGPPNLFRAAQRGVREELRLDPDQYTLRLLAFIAVTTYSQWGALFVARLADMSRADFEDNAGRGILDGWEHPEFDYVRFEPEAFVRYLLRDDRRDVWSPAAPALFYLAVVNAYGRRAVDDVVKRLARNRVRGGS